MASQARLQSVANYETFTFRFYGEPETSYVVQGSTNLLNWLPLATNQVSGLGYLEFTDTSATNYQWRFLPDGTAGLKLEKAVEPQRTRSTQSDQALSAFLEKLLCRVAADVSRGIFHGLAGRWRGLTSTATGF